ncbi:MAG: hypothetical protein GXO60_01650 [Epsilonproteobacteria bacterium]|nr:hypothetical protein [Campylobacterota bacterium]
MCKLLLISIAVSFFCGCASSSNQAKPALKTVQGVTNTHRRVIRNHPAGCRLLPNGYLVCLKN